MNSTDRLTRLQNLSPAKRALLIKALQKEAGHAPVIPKLPRQESYALSPAQQRLWFLEQFEAGLPSFNVPVAFRLAGQLNVPAFERALDEIVRRHEILRATFATKGEQPVQVIAEAVSPALALVDLAVLPESTRAAEVQRLAAAEAQRLFDLQKGPLYRATLLRLSEAEHVFLLTMHHLVCDGWSIEVFMRELAQLYQAFDAGQSSPLAELPIQYTDFAAWSRETGREKIEASLAYWKQQLAGAPPLLELPTDRPRPATQSYRGACEHFKLPAQLSEALHAFSKSEGVTLFMTLLAALQTLFHRYTGQDDIVIGSPVANRHHAEIENLIGFFVNTLVLRLPPLQDNPTFRELLARVRETTLGAFAHQEVPFEKLVETLRPERNLSHAPLFQVMFILQSATQISQFAGLTLDTLPAHNAAAKFDLTFDMAPFPDGLAVMLEYNTDLFEAATIKRMAGHFECLLQSLVANRSTERSRRSPDQRLSDVPLLTESERQQLLVDWNNTQKEYPREKCFQHLFEAQVERTPEAVAVVFEEQQLTYRELNRRANQLAHHLSRHCGVGPETMVGVCMERSPEMLIGLLGVLKAGGAYVPLDPAYPAERIAYVLEDAQVPVLLTQKSVIDNYQLSIVNCQLLCLDADWQTLTLENEANLNAPVESQNLAYTIYTSGSTGKPKGVNISHGMLVNFLFSMLETPGLAAADILLAVTTLSFDIAGLELYLPLLAGGRVVLASRETAADGKRLMAALADSGATIMQATPATWRMMIENGWSGSQELKILCGGEAMPRELANQLLERCAELWNMYGPTETTIWSTLDRIGNRDGVLSIGRPIANTQIYLCDRHLQIVPIGVHGALHIGGDGLARGYFKRPELTAEKFTPNPYAERPGGRIYHTGDLARYLAGGKIECLGRVDHQVKIRGFRIELGEIEAVCSQHPQIEQAVVVRDPSTALGADKRLVAYAVARGQRPPAVSELRQFIMKKLPDYMTPAIFVFLDALPLTPNGKVDRRALPAPDLNRRELPDTFVAPQLPIEKILAGIWHQVLGVAKIGIHDNFFELGGHSLLATQVNSRLRKIFGIDLPLRALFEAPTVAAFAQTMMARFGNNGKLEKIAQMMEKMNHMSSADKKKLLERKRQEAA